MKPASIRRTIDTALDHLARSGAVRPRRRSGAMHRALFDASREAIVVETTDGRVLDCNEAACRMFGREREEMLGIGVAELIPGELARNLRRHAPAMMDMADGAIGGWGRRSRDETLGNVCEALEHAARRGEIASCGVLLTRARIEFAIMRDDLLDYIGQKAA